jgi:hypothetical protein
MNMELGLSRCGRTQIEGGWEQNDEESQWTKQEWSGKSLKKIV